MDARGPRHRRRVRHSHLRLRRIAVHRALGPDGYDQSHRGQQSRRSDRHRQPRPGRLRQRVLSGDVGSQGRGGPQAGRAAVRRGAGDFRVHLPPRAGRPLRQHRRRRGPHGAAADGRGRIGVVPGAGASARRGFRAGRDAVDRRRHFPRARAQRELLSGPAACDRLSRSRARRILLRPAQRLHRLHERHPCRLAGLRHRAIRCRTVDVGRYSGRRRRVAAIRSVRQAGRSHDGSLRRRSQAPAGPLPARATAASRRLFA